MFTRTVLATVQRAFRTLLPYQGPRRSFRFNQDTDLDGFSDRTENDLGTDASDASSYPQPELLAGVHRIRVWQQGNQHAIAAQYWHVRCLRRRGSDGCADDSITINNNTVGGSGRVRAFKQVIVGSRILLQSPLPAPWQQANHAVPAAGGYYTGNHRCHLHLHCRQLPCRRLQGGRGHLDA